MVPVGYCGGTLRVICRYFVDTSMALWDNFRVSHGITMGLLHGHFVGALGLTLAVPLTHFEDALEATSWVLWDHFHGTLGTLWGICWITLEVLWG